MAMALLAGMTPPDVDLRFYDDRLEEIPFDEPTDLVAISVETFTALRAYTIARQFRARGVPVVLGGYHATLVPEEAEQEADAVVIGEAESAWPQVVENARQRRLQPVYRTADRPTLAGRPLRRELFAGKHYQNITLVEFTRGCRFHCDFCSITAFHGGSQNHRPVREVVAEMEASGSRRFFLVDDNLASRPDLLRDLCRELIPLKVQWVGQVGIHAAGDDSLLELMVASGCRGVLIGIESLDPGNLQAMGKAWNGGERHYAQALERFRRHGLAVYGTFLFGYDFDDAATIQRSVDFACQHHLFLAAFNHLTPFPGTPLYQRLSAEGRLLHERWWLDPDGSVGDVVFRPKRMSPEELQERCLQARRQFFGWKSILRRGTDFRSNARNPVMAFLFFALNIQAHFDIDLRYGLPLGGAVAVEEATGEPVSS
jgi:radical SAM superfamily enzyme YgiQ (UPF0313 family)